jgi:hypothetical protein
MAVKPITLTRFMSDEIGIRLERIRGKLKQVQRIKPVGFGWESHRYRLNPPLKERLLTDFEQTHGVTLPTEFRRFVLEVGDGGAGPAYGLQTYRNWGQWRSEQEPNTVALICPMRPAMGDSPPLASRTSDTWHELLRGTIEIVCEGCSFSIMLIVTGEYRGRVVRVDTEDDGFPYVTDDPDFLAWYERWLDHLLWGWDTSSAGEGLPGTEAQMVARLLDGSCSDRDRREALRTLRRVNKPTQETKRVALAQLEAGGPGVVAEALGIVDKHAWWESIETVGKLLQNPDREVRRGAIKILGKAKHPDWSELVRPLLGDSNDEVSFAALCVLIDGKQIQRTDLEPMISSPLPKERKTGIWAWGKGGLSVSSAPWFEARLRDEDIEVARSVILACNDAGDRAILPYLPELKARAGGKFDTLENNVRRNLSGLPVLLAGQLFGWRSLFHWFAAKWKSK